MNKGRYGSRTVASDAPVNQAAELAHPSGPVDDGQAPAVEGVRWRLHE